MNDFPNSHFKNVPLEKAYRLLTHGATVLVSAQHEQQRDVMAAAWADDRIFRDGHWHFQDADPEWRSLHHVAGGNFYLIGEEVSVQDRLKSP